MSHQHEPHHDCDHEHHHDHAHDHHHDHDHHHHEHAHGHAHHDHGHDHAHASDDYYLDQLCLIALSGAFGAICITMYFWKTTYLQRILAPQFFTFILLSGIALTVLFLMRAAALWKMSGQEAGAHDHDHGHDHHDHGHSHSHGHDHDHDHAWAPWRYVVLLVPIVLFLLDLPNPKSVSFTTEVDLTSELQTYSSLVAGGFDPNGQLALLAAAYASDEIGDYVEAVQFKELEQAAYLDYTRQKWEGKAVEVRGQYAPAGRGGNVFSLVRFRIQCCGADLIQLNVPMICKEPVLDIPPEEWVKVKGRVEFQKRADGQGYMTILRIPKAEYIEIIPPLPDQYIQ